MLLSHVKISQAKLIFDKLEKLLYQIFFPKDFWQKILKIKTRITLSTPKNFHYMKINYFLKLYYILKNTSRLGKNIFYLCNFGMFLCSSFLASN